MKNIAIFASGSGTNAENITRYFANSENVNVAVVLSNNRNVGVHGRVNKLAFPLSYSRGMSLRRVRLSWRNWRNMTFALSCWPVSWIRSRTWFFRLFPERSWTSILRYSLNMAARGCMGMHVHEAVVKACERESGITIHYINEHYDEGAIIFQASCRYYLRIRQMR